MKKFMVTTNILVDIRLKREYFYDCNAYDHRNAIVSNGVFWKVIALVRNLELKYKCLCFGNIIE